MAQLVSGLPETAMAGTAALPPVLTRRQAVKALAFSAGAMALGFALSGCARSDTGPQRQTATVFAFDTAVSLTVYGEEAWLSECLERVEFFERTFSRTRPNSDVARINQADGHFVEVEPETVSIIERALKWSEATDGLFDITIGAVSSLWDFKAGVIPDGGQLAEAVSHVNYQCVQVDGRRVRLADEAAAIDLGGIAKGFIADDLAALLARRGCKSALLDLGGNVYAVGTRPDGASWRVGVQDPNEARGEVMAAGSVQDASVVTSGLYERSFERDGEVFHHIIDPSTGFPAKTDLVSASVVGSSSLDGDAAATAMFLMGHSAAVRFLDDWEGMEGMLVDEMGTVLVTGECPLEPTGRERAKEEQR